MDKRSKPRTFSVGVCASDGAENLALLLHMIMSEDFRNNILKRIVAVASGCSNKTLTELHRIAREDERLLIIEESIRHGKGEAINRIIENSVGELLVLVNSDAMPERGAINTLLEAISSDARAGVISASPFFDHRAGPVSELLELTWALHNDWSLTLNHAGMNNHASDELMVANSQVLQKLPRGVVNDGAYIAGTAFLKGFQIRFSDTARVKIDVPRRLIDLIQQRRRIIFGHFQVWRWLGQSPRTAELMLFSAPRLSLGLLIRRVASSPRLLAILPIALISEFSAFLLAIKDTVTSSNQHVVWRRYGK